MRVRLDHKAQVVVIVPGLRLPRRDFMPVHVKNFRPHRTHVTEPALFARLPQRHRQQIRIAIRVPTELQPLPQFPMMRQQRPRPVRTHDPRRSRQMPRPTRPLQTLHLRLHKRDRGRDHLRFMRIRYPLRMFPEQNQNRVSMHRFLVSFSVRFPCIPCLPWALLCLPFSTLTASQTTSSPPARPPTPRSARTPPAPSPPCDTAPCSTA